MHLFIAIPTHWFFIMNLYLCNCSFIWKLCAFVLQSHLECSIRIPVYFLSENRLWGGFMNLSPLTSPFSHIPFKCLAFSFEMLCISPAKLDWSSCGANPNNAPSFAGESFQQAVSLLCQTLHLLTFPFLFTWLETFKLCWNSQ